MGDRHVGGDNHCGPLRSGGASSEENRDPEEHGVQPNPKIVGHGTPVLPDETP